MGRLLDYIRKLVLILLQITWAIRQQIRQTIHRCKWWFKCNVLKWQPKILRKRSKVPAIIGSDCMDVSNFVTWCFENEAEVIVVYDPRGCLTMDQIAVCVQSRIIDDRGSVVIQIEKSSAIVTRGSKQSKIQMVQGREMYREVLLDSTVQKDTPTKDFPGTLDTLKVDILVLCNQEKLSDFPPLALRACEIYFTSSPFTYTEYCRIANRFARSEQRAGI